MEYIDPMFHMDADYMWRWYITDERGSLAAMSTGSFFKYEDARRNYDDTMRRAA
jgi:hypothetical protein